MVFSRIKLKVHVLSRFRVISLSKLIIYWHISDANFDCKCKKFAGVLILKTEKFFDKTLKFSRIKASKQTFELIFRKKKSRVKESFDWNLNSVLFIEKWKTSLSVFLLQQSYHTPEKLTVKIRINATEKSLK